jgi:UDP-glucose 4-epimerase
VYGDRQHDSGQYAPVIGLFLKQYKNNESLTISGDGSQRRDFINVKDVVLANYNAFKYNKGFNVYNIGSGENISILHIARIISSNITFLPKREGECQQTLADIEKAKDLIKWEPTIKLGEYLNERI